eukprot:PhF_6_TR9136/c0_g1_i1/m.14209
MSDMLYAVVLGLVMMYVTPSSSVEVDYRARALRAQQRLNALHTHYNQTLSQHRNTYETNIASQYEKRSKFLSQVPRFWERVFTGFATLTGGSRSHWLSTSPNDITLLRSITDFTIKHHAKTGAVEYTFHFDSDRNPFFSAPSAWRDDRGLHGPPNGLDWKGGQDKNSLVLGLFLENRLGGELKEYDTEIMASLYGDVWSLPFYHFEAALDQEYAERQRW